MAAPSSTPRAAAVALALAALALVLALAPAGCGGEDSEPPAADGATGPAEARPAAPDVTVGEFVAELLPEKRATLERTVESLPGCEAVTVDNGFVLLISSRAIEADPAAPLAEIVEPEC